MAKVFSGSLGSSRRRKDTIFFPAKHKKIARVIKIDTPANARQSVKALKGEARGARPGRKMVIKRSMVLAANRSEVISKNPRVGIKDRREAVQVTRIYRQGAREIIEETRK